ncbi:phenylalanine--tRNA ligase subunit beta [Candidatus Nanohalobium constans]|uniref:Phenylalanine--tRNA ligase beta subunit n=1 Tax=Candidatus Nanohalobium constans TaxID=2565781 RepID=A0A5Q0UFX1_9ARCH|nr:phenylalanine--tRNA ligase subunit beta [Candidatus Nanohalobium constans]QGA80100.1 phenylalanyl-tRNA synthetase beta chain [Candidatus Nanohalobium constans]
MATLEIDKREFDTLVKREFEDEKLIEEASFLGAHWHSIDGNVCEVETYPNRPDLLSVEGLARAYRGFFDIEKGRTEYKVEEGSIEVEVDDSVEEVRPHIGGAVVKNLDLSKKVINGLIQLQEKMHQTMGRKRDKLAIGLHDLSTVEAPFTYKAVEPEQVSFKPLEYDKHMQLGEILDEHEKGQEYAWILDDEDRYPIIEDSEGRVLSFPPIINNQLTEVETGTEDIFIDVTGKDKDTVLKALNILTTALAERDGDIESATVDGEELPDLTPEEMELDVDYFQDVSGLDLEKSDIIERLKMMKYGAEGGENIRVEVPCYRNDVMHQYDLIEDVIIAHRYTNIDPELPEVDQIGRQKEVEDTAQVVRDIMSGAGALEAMTYVHDNRENLTDKIGAEDEEFVKVDNPISEEYSALRNLMTPSLLEVLKQNKHRGYPQKFFETGNVAVLDDSASGSSNKTKMVYVQIGEETDFTDARKMLQVLERDLGMDLEVRDGEKPFFMDARTGEVVVEDEKVGFIGQFSEEILENWELDKPTAGFELDLEKINEKLKK